MCTYSKKMLVKITNNNKANNNNNNNNQLLNILIYMHLYAKLFVKNITNPLKIFLYICSKYMDVCVSLRL